MRPMWRMGLMRAVEQTFAPGCLNKILFCPRRFVLNPALHEPDASLDDDDV